MIENITIKAIEIPALYLDSISANMSIKAYKMQFEPQRRKVRKEDKENS
jgi:hypothetical protein